MYWSVTPGLFFWLSSRKVILSVHISTDPTEWRKSCCKVSSISPLFHSLRIIYMWALPQAHSTYIVHEKYMDFEGNVRETHEENMKFGKCEEKHMQIGHIGMCIYIYFFAQEWPAWQVYFTDGFSSPLRHTQPCKTTVVCNPLSYYSWLIPFLKPPGCFSLPTRSSLCSHSEPSDKPRKKETQKTFIWSE